MSSSPQGDERSVGVMTIDAHEELIQHIESGQAMIRLLSVITLIVAGTLIASYFYQLLLPFASTTTVVEVNLLDPTLRATQVLLIILAGAWLFVGIINLRFAMRLGRKVREIRTYEEELMQRISAGKKMTA